MRLLLILFLLSYSFLSYSQTINATIETESVFRKHIYFPDGEERFGFADGNNIIQVDVYNIKTRMYAMPPRYGHAEHSLQIRKVDASGKEVALNKLEGGAKVFGPQSTIAVEFNNKLLLYYFRFLDQSRMELFQSEIDRNTLSLLNTKSIYQFPITKPNSLHVNSMYKAFMIKESPDKSHLLLAAAGINDQLFTAVLDEKLQMVHSKITNVKGTEMSQLEDVALANNGTIAVVFETYENSTLYQSSQFKALCGWVLGPDKNELTINFQKEAANGELFHPTVLITKDGSKVVFGGDYQGQYYKGGIWLQEISTTPLKENKTQRIPYTPELLVRMEKMGFGAKRRGIIGMNAGEYKLYELPDNQYLLGGSPEGITENIGSDGRRNRYHFTGPVLMAFIDQQKNATFTSLPRHNRFGGGRHSLFIPYKNKLIVLYNDLENNIKSPYNPDKISEKEFRKYKKLLLAVAIIGENRQVESRKIIGPGIGRSELYEIFNAVWASDKEVKIPASNWDEKKKQYQFVKVRIE